jgi:hypothetical protein
MVRGTSVSNRGQESARQGEIKIGVGRLPEVETRGLTNEGWDTVRMRVHGGGSLAAQEMLQ